MYGYSYSLVARGLHDQRRSGLPGLSPYAFEPGEPEDSQRGISGEPGGKPGVVALLAAYAMVVALVIAVSWIGGTDTPGSSVEASRGTDCVHATGVWTGCLPTR